MRPGALLAAAALVVGGCTSPTLLVPGSSGTTPARSSASPAAKVLVAGTASDTDGSAVAEVRVTFRRTDAYGSPVEATTGTGGAYTARLAPGRYTVSCTAPARRCTPELSGGGRTFQASGRSAAIDLDVSSVATTKSPTSPPGEGQGSGGDEAAGVTGHVYGPDGEGVPGITVEFQRIPVCPDICKQAFTTTDSRGAYALRLGDGMYNALCVVTSETYDCAARGSHGGPHPISVPPADNRVDFVLCKSAQYPRCVDR